MESMKIATHGKVSLRELNLSQGGNNVRWLNEREDRILQTSLNSLERARQKTLNRLQHEVKGLHHTLREQVTIRSPTLSKKSHFPDDTDNIETKRSSTTVHSVTFKVPLHDEILASKLEDGARSLVEDLEESTLEHIALEGKLVKSALLVFINEICVLTLVFFVVKADSVGKYFQGSIVTPDWTGSSP